MSAYAPTRVSSISTADMLAAYTAHGDDYMIIDIDTIKSTKFAQYIPIYIKKADGTIVHPYCWSLSENGITTCASIRSPDKREFESLRIGAPLLDSNGVESSDMRVLKELCEVFSRKLKKLKADEDITDDNATIKKKQAGPARPVYLISTKIVSPMRMVKKNPKTQEIEELDNPDFWINIGKKRFYNANETPKESIHWENKYYWDADKGVPNLDKPIMTYEFAPTFYNIDDFYFHPRTGKKVFRQLGDASDYEIPELNNVNIQNYLLKGSQILGGIRFEFVVTGRQAKLDLNLHGKIYVHIGEGSMADEEDDERLNAFSSRYNQPTKAVVDEELDEPDVDDF